MIFLFALAMADTKPPQYFTTLTSPIKAEQAIPLALQGKEIFKCEQVYTEVNKAGTSIGLKKKTVKDAN